MVIERPDLEDFMYAYALGEKVTSQVFHLALYLFLVLLNHVQSLTRKVLYTVLVLLDLDNSLLDSGISCVGNLKRHFSGIAINIALHLSSLLMVISGTIDILTI